MMDILQTRLVPSSDAADSAVGDETVILHLTKGIYYGLDAVGTRIWVLLKEGKTPAELCERIASEFGTDLQTVEDDARRFLTELEANDIVIRS